MKGLETEGREFKKARNTSRRVLPGRERVHVRERVRGGFQGRGPGPLVRGPWGFRGPGEIAELRGSLKEIAGGLLLKGGGGPESSFCFLHNWAVGLRCCPDCPFFWLLGASGGPLGGFAGQVGVRGRGENRY